MEIDKDIETFFRICHLDFKKFNFEDLVEGYKTFLVLLADKEEKFYLNWDVLEFAVFTFSKILTSSFEFEKENDCECSSFVLNKLISIWKRREKELNIRDSVMVYSYLLADKLINRNDSSYDTEYLNSIIKIMFKNCYNIEGVYMWSDENLKNKEYKLS